MFCVLLEIAHKLGTYFYLGKTEVNKEYKKNKE